MDSHEKYLELCAASTAGELSAEEEVELETHLANCALCRHATHEFELTIEKAVAPFEHEFPSRSEKSDANWSIEKAEAAFFERLRMEKGTVQTDAAAGAEKIEVPAGRRFTYRPSNIPWAELWMPVAACVLLAITLGIVAYRSGVTHGADSAQLSALPAKSTLGSVEEQISDFGHERAQLLAKLTDDDRALNDLKSGSIPAG